MQRTDTMKAVPLFEGLSDRQLESLSRAFPRRSYGAGETIFRDGEPAEGFYILLREG